MMIVAHRGLHQEHPENSLEAFAAAWKAGVSWCECDVHASSDSVPMVIHDPTLDRTTSGSGAVAGRSADELQKLGVPTLQQVVDAMPESCGMLIEIKPKQGSRGKPVALSVMQIIKDRRAIIQSFDATNLYLTRPHDREREHYLLVDKNQHWEAGVWNGINFCHDMVTADVVETLRAKGSKWGAWTVNREDDIRRILALRPDMVISDDPLLVSRLELESVKQT